MFKPPERSEGGFKQSALPNLFNQLEKNMAQNLNTQTTYWASSDYHEFEVELLEETEYGDFKVRCVLEDEILILTGHLWSLELMTDNGKMIYDFSRTDRTEF